MPQGNMDATKQAWGIRWKLEPFHRESKQVTGLEHCQCRKQRAQRNHIACAILVWVQLNKYAQETSKTIYQLKEGLLSNYMRQEMEKPMLEMVLI